MGSAGCAGYFANARIDLNLRAHPIPGPFTQARRRHHADVFFEGRHVGLIKMLAESIVHGLHCSIEAKAGESFLEPLQGRIFANDLEANLAIERRFAKISGRDREAWIDILRRKWVERKRRRNLELYRQWHFDEYRRIGKSRSRRKGWMFRQDIMESGKLEFLPDLAFL